MIVLGTSLFFLVLILHFSFPSAANAHDMRLQSRESRKAWETDFSSVVLAPAITVRSQ